MTTRNQQEEKALTTKLKEARLYEKPTKQRASEGKTRFYDLDSLRWYETRKVGPQKYEETLVSIKTQPKLKSERWKGPETIENVVEGKETGFITELCRTFSWLAVPHSKERTIANLNDLLLSTLTALQEIGEYEVAIIAKNSYEKLAWLNYTPKDKRPKTQRSLSAFLKNQRDSGKLKVASGGETATQITLDDIIEFKRKMK